MAQSGNEASFSVVGVGISAGGIQALEGFFQWVPAHPGAAFVVIAHLPRGRESMMPEIVQRFTTMPVVEARDGQAIEPDHVYLNTGNAVLSLAEGRFETLTGPGDRHPIDAFFSALAENFGERAVAVVLSGSGSDGALGLRAIKERGGFVIAQGEDGFGPLQSGMPTSAIATGLVDLVAPAAEIGGRLVELRRSGEAVPDLAAQAEAEDVVCMRQAICAVLRERLGHDFSGYKAATFLRRVRRRMQVCNAPTLDAYLTVLRGNADEAGHLFRDLLIGVTKFFRDGDAFEALERQVVGRLIEGKAPGEAVRVWVPGCASGEEAYSIAILLHERLGERSPPLNVQIFATDIDEAALAIARAGRYPRAFADSVSPARLERYFVADAGEYVVAKAIRDMCMFSVHNVIRDMPFSRMDLISCRNLFIYLDANVQSHLASLFHYALRPGGYLFLGTSENLTQHRELFAALDKKHSIFQRRDHVASYARLPTGFPSTWRAASVAQRNLRPAPGADPIRRMVELRVLDRFAPAHVLVNRDGEVLYYSAHTGAYLEPAAGLPSRHIDSLARKGLRLQLRGALNEAIETRRPVVRGPMPIDAEDRVLSVMLHIEPMGEHNGEASFLVVFREVEARAVANQFAGKSTEEADAVAAALDEEVRDLRERLLSSVEEYESTVEELRSANEELVSLNEEMQSSNEELETSKEEIQSINEELQTTNAELTIKLEELERANSDMRNLLESTQIATVFLDSDLLIRRFTPSVSSIFSLIPGDVGRPLTDIVHRLKDFDLGQELNGVLETHESAERPVEQVDGRSYLMRILPYRTEKGALDGLIVTFVDVTQLKEARHEGDLQRTMLDELNHRLRNLLAVVISVVDRTLETDAQPAEIRPALHQRLAALAKAYVLVWRNESGGIELRKLFETELAPYREQKGECVVLEGPPLRVAAPAALPLSMTFHELATNAAKHGALSAPEGVVHVKWERMADRLIIEWRESGGPPPAEPRRRGFGTSLIDRQIAYDLNGESTMTMAPEGLVARFSIPLARISPAAGTTVAGGPAGVREPPSRGASV